MKKLLVILLTSVFVLTACGGKTAQPVPQYQGQDDHMTCDMIDLEIQDNQTKIMTLIPKESKLVKNTALGVAGYFLIVPWFFMDFSDAEKVEVEAFQLRNNHLRMLHHAKNCSGDLPEAIEFQNKEDADKAAA